FLTEPNTKVEIRDLMRQPPTVLVGQAWGAQNIEKVQSVVGSTLFMTIIGGIITAILGVFFAHDILELLGTDPKVMHLALPYVQ
ncbi:MATE family efflux transporter, partial [Escherichia coli]|uniref:MATE family efflux transporter n=1 Tax=Escherichia coli TaxID=562 RepID=UPI003BFBB730